MRGCLLILMLAFALPGYAGQEHSRVPVAEQRSISESQAASAAQHAVPGKVLGVQRVKTGDQVIFKVKILTDDGRVRIVTVDGASGRVLSR